jgi:hypothetical protein
MGRVSCSSLYGSERIITPLDSVDEEDVRTVNLRLMMPPIVETEVFHSRLIVDVFELHLLHQTIRAEISWRPKYQCEYEPSRACTGQRGPNSVRIL